MSASSYNRQTFTIQDSSRSLQQGESIEITFIAKSTSSAIQLSNFIRKLTLNEHEICGNNIDAIDDNCAELEVIDGPSGGRFDGLLTFYPKYTSSVLQVIVEVDNSALALGVSFECIRQI